VNAKESNEAITQNKRFNPAKVNIEISWITAERKAGSARQESSASEEQVSGRLEFTARPFVIFVKACLQQVLVFDVFDAAKEKEKLWFGIVAQGCKEIDKQYRMFATMAMKYGLRARRQDNSKQ